MDRSGFSIRPRQGMFIFFGKTTDADLFAAAVARALLDDAGEWSPLQLSTCQHETRVGEDVRA